MAIEFDDLERRPGFFVTAKPEQVTFLPEPERRARWCTLVSVDDHLVEPPHLFDGRLPARLQDGAPHVDVDEAGMEFWAYDGQRHYKVGLNAVVGRPREELSFEPTRFDEMRRGAWDIDARVHDMDLNGVYASLNFPSSLAGFAGQRYQLGVSDPELALAVVRAANEWHLEEWAGTHPGRIIPCQVPWLLDPEVGAAEVRANAARGFRAVTFPELPERLGLSSLHTGYWDPFLAACEETGTVVCLHVGSSSTAPTTSSDAPADTIGVLFFGWAMFAAVDWLYSRIPVRFAGLRICLSEGGIGWVAGLLDRLDHVARYQHMYGTWDGIDLTPSEVLQRNFWFCAIEDRSGLEQRHRIGIDHICLESDYPHQDGTWPDTQELLRAQLDGFPTGDVRKLTWENASNLFDFPVPIAVQEDPDAY
ncbi:MAG TPA: amidohydrolase family protein [Acidimicrobiia bacterium]|nr:amidohydrolase family protein [Acidimicrobiia bacterium]